MKRPGNGLAKKKPKPRNFGAGKPTEKAVKTPYRTSKNALEVLQQIMGME